MKHVKQVCKIGSDKCEQCNYDTHPDLFTCKVCTASEAELPSECPERKMTDAEKQSVQNGTLDFKHAIWSGSLSNGQD